MFCVLHYARAYSLNSLTEHCVILEHCPSRVCEGDKGSVGDTKRTGAHTVMTHGTPTLFPHNIHMNAVHIHSYSHTQTQHIQLMRMSLAGTGPSYLHVVCVCVLFFAKGVTQ